MINLQEAVYKIIHCPMLNRRQAQQLVRDIYKRGFEEGKKNINSRKYTRRQHPKPLN